jgi:endonuclease G, mitochondrial
MPTSLKRHWMPLLALFLAAWCAAADPLPRSAQDPARNVRFGLPSPARPDPAQREDYLIPRPQYTLSYNAKTKRANWVSWALTKADIGHASRGPFTPDPLLPKGFTRITSQVYNNSGFDRGHMCPAKDRSATQEDCDATFRMTNVVPQSPASNQKGWERLESYCRDLALRGHELDIVCGPHGVGGEGKLGRRDEIGRGRMRVTVPHELWKVILVLPHEGAEPRKNTRVIAVIMPNDQSVDFNWAKYRVSAAAVEKLTGYTFFRNVPEDVAAALKDNVDDVEVRVKSPRQHGSNKRKKKSD